MADSSIKNDFTGLPMEELIGAPLQAACKAQANLSQTSIDFIKNVGFKNTSDDSSNLEANMINFKFKRPSVDEAGNESIDEASLSVPLLSIVKTPNLSIQDVNVSFDMEVKTATSETSKTNTDVNTQADSKAGIWFAKTNISIKGSVSTSRENTRSTDTSAKYHVDLHASDTGMPEGLSRVFDILNSTIVPRVTSSSNTTIKDNNATIDDNKK